VVGERNGVIGILINNGAGSFSDGSSRLGSEPIVGLAVGGDLDGDGAVDHLIDERFGAPTTYLQRGGNFVEGSSLYSGPFTRFTAGHVFATGPVGWTSWTSTAMATSTP